MYELNKKLQNYMTISSTETSFPFKKYIHRYISSDRTNIVIYEWLLNMMYLNMAHLYIHLTNIQ